MPLYLGRISGQWELSQTDHSRCGGECQEAGCRGLVFRHSIRGRNVDQNIRGSPEPGGKRNSSANLGVHIELLELEDIVDNNKPKRKIITNEYKVHLMSKRRD
jgi:hypothetical protein